MSVGATRFDPVKHKETTREQWQAVEPWFHWGPIVEEWLPGQPVPFSPGGASSKERTEKPGSARRKHASFLHRCACPPPRRASASKGGLSGRFTR